MIKKVICYRNFAEQLRQMADDTISENSREGLLRAAAEYDHAAACYEAIIRAQQSLQGRSHAGTVSSTF